MRHCLCVPSLLSVQTLDSRFLPGLLTTLSPAEGQLESGQGPPGTPQLVVTGWPKGLPWWTEGEVQLAQLAPLCSRRPGDVSTRWGSSWARCAPPPQRPGRLGVTPFRGWDFRPLSLAQVCLGQGHVHSAGPGPQLGSQTPFSRGRSPSVSAPAGGQLPDPELMPVHLGTWGAGSGSSQNQRWLPLGVLE